MAKYFIYCGPFTKRAKYRKVCKKEYIQWEKKAGFTSKFKTKPATSSFGSADYYSGIEIKGKIVYG